MEAMFALPVGAALIFVLRAIDVCMATMRVILSFRGARLTAATIGFFEALVWIVTVGHVLRHLNSLAHVSAYAAGFATGSYMGVWLENRLALGLSVVHAVCSVRTESGNAGSFDPAAILRRAGYAVTETVGRGRDGTVDLLQIVVPRRRVSSVIRFLLKGDAHAFITVEEVRATHGGHLQLAGRKTPMVTLPTLKTVPRTSSATGLNGNDASRSHSPVSAGASRHGASG